MEHFLQELFLGVLNMSLTGSYVILVIMAVRLALKKAPKIFSYCLWGIVLIRLLVPVSFSSGLSFFGLLPGSTGETSAMPGAADFSVIPWTGTPVITAADSAAANPGVSASAANTAAVSLQTVLPLLSALWLLGTALLLIYSIMTYWKLKQQVRTAVRTDCNTYESGVIGSPCVIGIFRPKIYLPFGLNPSEKSYILKHEQIHIKRFDHLLKPAAFLTLCIHWFNPLVWVAFLLMSRDMEMSCDESVVKALGSTIKKDYSASLLAFAVPKNILRASPLTFGEGNTERRIRNILNYRRLPVWFAVIILLILSFIGFGLLTGPDNAQDIPDRTGTQQFQDQEIRSMAEIWAEALRTRDGEPRYEIMSGEMKEEFIAGQKDRSDPWNFNIGVSSPWVTDYEITVGEGQAEILYHMTDSTQGKYDKTEILYLGKENGKTVVVKSEELLSEWQRASYYPFTADEAMYAYTKALLSSNYSTILALTPSFELEPYGQLIWDTIKITDVKVVREDVRDRKACYELELTIADGGNSAFETGTSPRWLWLAKGEKGWYAEGLMTGGPPDENWWNNVYEL